MDSSILIYALLQMDGWGAKKVYSLSKQYNFNPNEILTGLEKELTLSQKREFEEKIKYSEYIINNSKAEGVESICLLDTDFPSKLYAGSDKCVFLFYKGEIHLLNKTSIAIIGTRNPNEPFIHNGEVVTKYFSKKGYTIVSGLAKGCDTIAHKGTLDVGGCTIAVLPSPCNKVEPAINVKLAEDIVKNGGLLISEYGIGSKVTRFNYPERDRIQSLLSDKIIVIESTDDGGTMIAVRKHIKDGKMVFALKGNNLKIIDNYIDPFNQDDLDWVENSSLF